MTDGHLAITPGQWIRRCLCDPRPWTGRARPWPVAPHGPRQPPVVPSCCRCVFGFKTHTLAVSLIRTRCIKCEMPFQVDAVKIKAPSTNHASHFLVSFYFTEWLHTAGAVCGRRTWCSERMLKFLRISVHVKRKYAIVKSIVKSQTWGRDQVPQCAIQHGSLKFLLSLMKKIVNAWLLQHYKTTSKSLSAIV